MIFDTHIHLMESPIIEHLDDELQQAKDRDVTDFCCVGYDQPSSLKAVELALKYPHIYASIGVQPEEIQKAPTDDLAWIKDILEQRLTHEIYKKKIVAIGEIGLDYYWEKEDAPLQKEFFFKQLTLAEQYDMPIIIHCRSAIQDTFDMIKKFPTVKGVLHCYSGSLEMAKAFTKRGYYIGVGGVVTFKNSKEIKDVVSNLGLDHIVSETDAPYLAPVPHRGEKNRPCFIRDTVDYISQLVNVDNETTQLILYRNACDLLRIK